MNLGPRAEVPSHQSPVTSATVVLSILPLIPNVSKRASNDRARKHQCSHGMRTTTNLAFNSGQREFSTGRAYDSSRPLFQLSQRNDVGLRDSVECCDLGLLLRLKWGEEFDFIVVI